MKVHKICFIIPYLSDGGAERVVSVLASELADLGLDIIILKYHSMLDEYPVSPKVKVRTLVEGNIDEYKSLKYLTKIRLIRKILIEENPEYVVPFLPHVSRHIAIAGIGLHLKTIETIRVAPWLLEKKQRVIRDYLIRKSYRTFVQTQSQKEYFPVKIHEKIIVLPNPVSNIMFDINHYQKTPYLFVSAGRISTQKNFRLIIDAAIRLKQKGYDFKVEIYGKGDLEENLKDYIRANNADKYCSLMGRSNQIAQVYKNSDVFILSSDYEGMPNALMEAMATALPCISTECPTGPKELLGNDRGILIRMGDIDELVDAMEFCLNHPEEILRMGKKAKQYMWDHYSASAIADSFIKNVLQQ